MSNTERVKECRSTFLGFFQSFDSPSVSASLMNKITQNNISLRTVATVHIGDESSFFTA